MELLLFSVIKNNREKIKNYENANVMRNPVNIIDDRRMGILQTEKDLISAMQMIFNGKKSQFGIYSSKLESLNPLSVLTRGYCVAYKDKKILRKVDDAEVGSQISVKLSNGFIDASVVNKRKEREEQQ